MDLIKVEKLAVLAQNGDKLAKEDLANEFRPFILNLSKKTFLNGFEFEDIQNECYRSLFKALKMYNPERERFVAYATITIKNSINLLIRHSTRRNKTDSKSVLTLTDNLENVLSYDLEFVEDRIIQGMINSKLKTAIDELDYEEHELVVYVYIKKCPLKQFAEYIGLPYHKVFKMKNRVLKKLKKILGEDEEWMCRN